ncbi:CvpA family protein [Staphylococcus canis]|uniref:CvpA family protein n=1 Tax=Staphylococcus canis TaxID=2724942 RepID=A0ABS0T6Y4_9STAP|nr:CvpA family protein [Staphylococcus canis]
MYEFIGVIVIIAFILTGFYKGGLTTTLYFLGTVFAIWSAHQLYQPFSERLQLFIPFPKTVAFDIHYALPFDQPSVHFVKLIGFILIVIVVKILLRFVMSSMNHFLETISRHMLSRIVGAIVGMGSGLIVLHFMFYVFALYPNHLLQSSLKTSIVGQWIVLYIPFLSDITLNL